MKAGMNFNDYREHINKLNTDADYKQKWEEEQERLQKERWLKLKPFKNDDDVPSIPIPITEFYIKRLIELGAIPKSELEVGFWYYGEHRRTNLAKWEGDRFTYYRYKFGWYIDDCNHFQDDDGFALFVPLRLADEKELEKIEKIKEEYKN